MKKLLLLVLFTSSACAMNLHKKRLLERKLDPQQKQSKEVAPELSDLEEQKRFERNQSKQKSLERELERNQKRQKASF